MNAPLGIACALFTAVCWALAPIAHAAAGRRIGAFATNLWRALAASILLVLTVLATHGTIPSGPAGRMIAFSGIVGVGVGDLLIYDAFVRLGPRRGVQLLALGPVFSFFLAWAWLHETVNPIAFAGAALVLAASGVAIWIERRAGAGTEPGEMTMRGLASALGGAALLGFGAVLARQAWKLDPAMDPIGAATVRVGAATVMLWVIPLFGGPGAFRRLIAPMADKPLLIRIGIGTLFGPYLGMLTYVAAFRYLEAGLVSSLVALSPLVILPLAVYRHRARVGPATVAAALAAVAGVALISRHA
jgi:drug/metabolite transporter (DMT)-like permease